MTLSGLVDTSRFLMDKCSIWLRSYFKGVVSFSDSGIYKMQGSIQDMIYRIDI